MEGRGNPARKVSDSYRGGQLELSRSGLSWLQPTINMSLSFSVCSVLFVSLDLVDNMFNRLVHCKNNQ